MKTRLVGAAFAALAALSLTACASSSPPNVPKAPDNNTNPKLGWVQVTDGIPGWKSDYSEVWKTCDGTNLIYIRGDTRSSPYVLADNAECK